MREHRSQNSTASSFDFLGSFSIGKPHIDACKYIGERRFVKVEPCVLREHGRSPVMTAPSEADVLVVGAGPTGLTLAAQLHALGAGVRIVDRQLDRVHKSRALAPRGEPPFNCATDVTAAGRRLIDLWARSRRGGALRRLLQEVLDELGEGADGVCAQPDHRGLVGRESGGGREPRGSRRAARRVPPSWPDRPRRTQPAKVARGVPVPGGRRGRHLLTRVVRGSEEPPQIAQSLSDRRSAFGGGECPTPLLLNPLTRTRAGERMLTERKHEIIRLVANHEDLEADEEFKALPGEPLRERADQGGGGERGAGRHTTTASTTRPASRRHSSTPTPGASLGDGPRSGHRDQRCAGRWSAAALPGTHRPRDNVVTWLCGCHCRSSQRRDPIRSRLVRVEGGRLPGRWSLVNGDFRVRSRRGWNMTALLQTSKQRVWAAASGEQKRRCFGADRFPHKGAAGRALQPS